MKTTLKQLTAGTFIALLIIAGNVKAEGTEIKAANIIDTESSLRLENWMTNETIWNANSISYVEAVQEMEDELELENWMTNAESWNRNNGLIEEAETEMGLENWMTNEKSWNTDHIVIEPELRLEAWMTDNNIWKQS